MNISLFEIIVGLGLAFIIYYVREKAKNQAKIEDIQKLTEVVEKVHSEIQRLLTKVGFKDGAMNFDIAIDKNEEVYILEIGARNGGNMIPELTDYCTGVDMKVYSIKFCLGMDCSDLKMTYEKRYFSHYVVHSQRHGVVKSVYKSPRLSKCILYEHYNFQTGDFVKEYLSSSNRLGIMLLQYENKNEMLDLINNMSSYLIIKTQ